MKIAIRELREDDGEVISFLKIHFSQLWRVGEDEIHDKWVTPSLENEKFPYIFVPWLENTLV